MYLRRFVHRGWKCIMEIAQSQLDEQADKRLTMLEKSASEHSRRCERVKKMDIPRGRQMPI